MNPKYLKAERVGETGLADKQAQVSQHPLGHRCLGSAPPLSPKPQWPPAPTAHAHSWDVIPTPKAAAQAFQGKRSPSRPQPCHPQGGGRQRSLCAKLLALRATSRLLTTHLLFFGWYPQKEMFFSWKKWLHLFT